MFSVWICVACLRLGLSILFSLISPFFSSSTSRNTCSWVLPVCDVYPFERNFSLRNIRETVWTLSGSLLSLFPCDFFSFLFLPLLLYTFLSFLSSFAFFLMPSYLSLLPSPSSSWVSPFLLFLLLLPYAFLSTSSFPFSSSHFFNFFLFLPLLSLTLFWLLPLSLFFPSFG